MTPNHCGMDFGTSNSTFAVAGGNMPARLLPLEDGKPTIPSAIFFSFEEEATYFGRKAVSEYVSGADGRLMRSIKSVLGTGAFRRRHAGEAAVAHLLRNPRLLHRRTQAPR